MLYILYLGFQISFHLKDVTKNFSVPTFQMIFEELNLLLELIHGSATRYIFDSTVIGLFPKILVAPTKISQSKIIICMGLSGCANANLPANDLNLPTEG